jgi:tetratricopeptide (TPR) repeat protein
MTGQFGKALEDYHDAIEINPKNGFAYNGLAWLRATCPVASFRNGEEAVKAATKACELTNWQIANWIDTLAAANAEMGNFAQAIKYEKQAIAMAGSSEKYLRLMQRSLSLYERHEPNHEGQKQ